MTKTLTALFHQVEVELWRGQLQGGGFARRGGGGGGGERRTAVGHWHRFLKFDQFSCCRCQRIVQWCHSCPSAVLESRTGEGKQVHTCAPRYFYQCQDQGISINTKVFLSMSRPRYQGIAIIINIRHQESFTKTFFQNETLSIKQEYKLMQVKLKLQKIKEYDMELIWLYWG